MRGGGVPYCPWWGGPWSEHGVSPFDHPLWAGGRCCGGHYLVVPPLEDCTPELRRGVVAVCRGGGGGALSAGCGGRQRGERCRRLVRWPVPTVPDGSGPPGGLSPLELAVGVWFLAVTSVSVSCVRALPHPMGRMQMRFP